MINQLTALREAQNLSHRKLAKLAGIPSHATISRMEEGKEISFSNIRKIIKALGYDIKLVKRKGTQCKNSYCTQSQD